MKNIENKLAKAQEELNVLKAEYEEYAYVVSHDLIAPLRQIEGFSNIIYAKHADQFDDKTKRHFDLIVSGAEKGKDILDALLDYSKLNTPAKPFSPVDSKQIIDGVTNKLTSMIEESSADISCVDTPLVIGDSAQLHQVFYHLIHNALHYQYPGKSPTVSIDARETEDHWQFCINDNGIGIPDHLTEKVFTILRRAVTDKEYSGIGMGLAIAKKIVQCHGGRLWVVTKKNAGSSFYFTIAKELQCE